MCTGELSRDRLSGVCAPLEWADSTPVWLGEAGALLGDGGKTASNQVYIKLAVLRLCVCECLYVCVCCNKVYK